MSRADPRSRGEKIPPPVWGGRRAEGEPGGGRCLTRAAPPTRCRSLCSRHRPETIQRKEADRLGGLPATRQVRQHLAHHAAELEPVPGEAARQGDVGMVSTAKELKEKIIQHEEELARKRQSLEMQKRQIAEKTGELNALLKQASEILADLSGKKYSLEY